MIVQKDIFGKTRKEIEDLVNMLHLPAYTTMQICEWLYQKRVYVFDHMTNLSKKTREILNENFKIGVTPPTREQLSKDGTKKYLFPLHEGHYVETVYIPDRKRETLCISTQVGCKMNCMFCMTGKQGFHSNLSSGEILNQIISVPDSETLTNLVFMGMGEPADNLDNVLNALDILCSPYGFNMSSSRITVSTAGLLPGLKELITNNACHLAISLNSPFPEERKRLMPIEKAFPIQKIIEFLKQQSINRQRRISFEYIMFKGVNDTPRHIKELIRLLNGIRCRINLIRFHALPGDSLEPSSEQSIQWFKNKLNEKGLLTTIRASRGQDIQAACGLLSTKENEKANKPGNI